jgi:hypothetical protein
LFAAPFELTELVPGSVASEPAQEKCQSREEELAMGHHAFSMVLYGITGYTLMNLIVAGLWGIRMHRCRQAEVRVNGLEPIIRGWLNDSDLSTEPASNPTWNFGFLTTLPNGESVHIMQMKEHPDFLAFQANLAISTEHQAILKAMPIAYFEKLAQEIVLGVFLANVAIAIRTRLSGVSFFSKLAITTDLNQDDLLKHLYGFDNAISLSRKAILLAAARAPRLVVPGNIRSNKF